MSQGQPHTIYVRDLDGTDDTRFAHARSYQRGDEVRLALGAYTPAAPWADLDALEKYRLRIRAVVRTRRIDMVVSHLSAAAVHGISIAQPWPDEVHMTVGLVSGGRSRRGVVKHALEIGSSDVVEIDGMLVTSIARTVVDLATTSNRYTAIVGADRALLVDPFGRFPPLATREQLWESYLRRGNFRGAGRAKSILEFAETGSESALESVSRLSMRTIRCPAPQLQVPFRDHGGSIGRVDFYWHGYRLVGEADGDVKYVDAAMRGDRSAPEVVLQEKRREDRIRALGERVTRWTWAIGINPLALRDHLRRAGLPIP